MDRHHPVSYEPNPHPQDLALLNQGIAAYAQQKTTQPPIEFFTFFVRDTANNIQAGCHGNTLYGCLHIDQLWVAEPLRHQGYGKALMLAAEEFGRKNQCNFATVNTMHWEALDFYKKLGYYVEFARMGFLDNAIFYFLRKDFSAATV